MQKQRGDSLHQSTAGELLLGNQAIARGAWEAGVRVLTAYPGTPSTEITKAAAGFSGIQTQWAPNEKVAAEVAYGAALAGARAMVRIGETVHSPLVTTGGTDYLLAFEPLEAARSISF